MKLVKMYSGSGRTSHEGALDSVARGLWITLSEEWLSGKATLVLKVGKRSVMLQGRVEWAGYRDERWSEFFPSQSAVLKAQRVQAKLARKKELLMALRGVSEGFSWSVSL